MTDKKIETPEVIEQRLKARRERALSIARTVDAAAFAAAGEAAKKTEDEPA